MSNSMITNQNPCNMQNFIMNNNLSSREQFNLNQMNQINNMNYANLYYNYLNNMMNNMNCMNIQNNYFMNNNTPMNNQIYNSMNNPLSNSMNSSINTQLNFSICNSTPNAMINPMSNSMNFQINNQMNPMFNPFMNSTNNNMMMPFNTCQMNNFNQNLINMNLLYEQNLIFNKIMEIFFTTEFFSLKTEKDVLNFFSKGEEKCSNFINNNSFNNDKSSLQNYMESMLEYIFKNSRFISDIILDIYSKLNDIYVEKLKSDSEFHRILEIIFGDAKLPYFLTYREAQKISYDLNPGTDSVEYLQSMDNRFTEASRPILDIYTKIKKKFKPLNGIDKKYELFILFIAINNEIFHKIYGGEIFFEFLRFNEREIKKYFGQNFRYQKVFEEFNSMTNSQIDIKVKETFEIIEKEINKEINKIYNIIASLYYLLIHVFKDNKQKHCFNNLGSVHINLLLKNIAIFFDKKYKNLFLIKNLFALLNDIYSFDIEHLIKVNKYPSEYNYYSFEQIDQLLSEDEISKLYYLVTKKKLEEKNSLFTELFLGRYENKIRLCPVNINVKTNIITILVDGFMSENKEPKKQWKGFLDYFKNNETMFYFYKWPASKMPNIFFNDASYRAELSGAILAYLLISNKFKKFQINLIGYSLGNHVIKHCIMELYKIYCNSGRTHFANLKNVIFIAGATEISNNNEWKNYIKKLIGDRIINCYSKNDDVLGELYTFYKTNGRPIGLEPLSILDNDKTFN